MASKTPVGFIGLGNMGSPMAKNLLKNGYPVIATDVFPESCKELQDLGAQVRLSQYSALLVHICRLNVFFKNNSILALYKRKKLFQHSGFYDY